MTPEEYDIIKQWMLSTGQVETTVDMTTKEVRHVLRRRYRGPYTDPPLYKPEAIVKFLAVAEAEGWEIDPC